jgi:hypothetical protein
VRRRPALIALAALAAVAGIVLGFSLGGGGGSGSPTTPAGGREGSSSATGSRRGTTEVEATRETTGETGTRTTIPHVGTIVAKPSSAPFGHRLLVGTVDDSLENADPALAASVATVSQKAGFDAVLVSSMWKRGQSAPSADQRTALGNAVAAARTAGLRVFVSVWHGLNGGTPRSAAERQQFARYTAALARAFPSIDHVVVGNEPNLNTFWMPQFGAGGSDAAASAYFDLLARTYDALKAVSRHIEVIGGALAPRGADRPLPNRDTHSPTRFIQDLGGRYRSSGRTKPIMDAFAIHPYMRTSALPPTETHADSSTITIADYPKLAALLSHAFAGTAQRGRGLPVYYTEFGVQTTVPAKHRSAYTDFGADGASDAVDPAIQAKYYRQALLMAACQATVRGLFVFHTFDERDLRGWQSGLYYADQQPKPSLGAFRHSAALARAARLTRCAGGTFVRTE